MLLDIKRIAPYSLLYVLLQVITQLDNYILIFSNLIAGRDILDNR